jgi:hypothetical protein
MFQKIWPKTRLPPNSRDLLRASNLRHGTDGFTSPPKKGVLRILLPNKYIFKKILGARIFITLSTAARPTQFCTTLHRLFVDDFFNIILTSNGNVADVKYKINF